MYTEQPPSGADPLMWRLASQVRRDHEADAHGWCEAPTCRRANALAPCPAARLASVGLDAANGSRAPWSSLNRRVTVD